MRERHVAHPQLVHGPQRGQSRLDAVTALQADQADDLTLLVTLQDVCR